MSQPTSTLPSGFTPQADTDFQEGVTMVLVHRWPPGWSPGTLAGQWVQTPVEVKGVDGGSLHCRAAGKGQEFSVLRGDIHGWSLTALVRMDVRRTMTALGFQVSPLSPWQPYD